jgi:hypothetical protein
MNKHFFFLLLTGLLTFAAVNAYAQDEKKVIPNYAPLASTSLEGGRFEMVTTAYEDIPVTYKVDKYTGDVWKLTTGFRPLKLIKFTRESDANDIAEEGKVNYQFVARSASTLFLINVNTGVMWEKTPDDLFKEVNAFQIIRER